MTCYTLLHPQLQDATKPTKKKISTTFCETRRKGENFLAPTLTLTLSLYHLAIKLLQAISTLYRLTNGSAMDYASC